MINSEDGFTLIEMLLTILIFAIVGLTLASVFMNGAFGLQLSSQKNHNINTAQYNLNEAILNFDNTGLATITVIFNEDQVDEISLTVNGTLIQEEINGVILEYFEVVIPDA